MIKEAEIKISSVIENLNSAGIADGEAERSESVHSGYLHIRGEDYFLTYREENEGVRTTSEIKYYPDGRVSVSRSGGVESSFLFVEGETTASLYRVPPYAFDAEIRTRRIRTSLSESGGVMELIYDMKIGGAEKSARMKIWISTNLRQG